MAANCLQMRKMCFNIKFNTHNKVKAVEENICVIHALRYICMFV